MTKGGAPAPKRLRAYRRGGRAETLACIFLMFKGFRIVARNWKTPLGEVDIIARRGSLIVIAEVKARDTLEAAMEAVGPHALRRIEAAGDLWLARQSGSAQFSIRYDLIAVLPRKLPKHVKNIWQNR
ncbi:YraN family protein [Limoniibacter endophyticus]|uniref:UPF0102 protein GCM10010136_33970 n=1 Tax=Limoniibacter endophyticus TaxID=1565040 RepID=A0A8J3DTD9_9HYPH|nr:YraN family protein [Limoniibacter endophyticus]GHC80692.1 UPF0102 protein [Limoniibacter endophyticus]